MLSHKEKFVYTHTQMGSFHTQHNEDAYVVADLGQNLTLLAVLDGCSMGIESHFSATLVVKLLRKITTTLSYEAFAKRQVLTPIACLERSMKALFQDLKILKNQWFLQREELLTTLVIGVLDRTQCQAELLVVGDGLIGHNGHYHEYDQDNRPDYLGYHLDLPFDKWYANQQQRLSLPNIQYLSLCTDGVFSFQPFDALSYPHIEEQAILDHILAVQPSQPVENWLWQAFRSLELDYGLRPTDDCTVIRVLLKAIHGIFLKWINVPSIPSLNGLGCWSHCNPSAAGFQLLKACIVNSI